MKICTKCKISQPETAYYKYHERSGKRRADCAECCRKHARRGSPYYERAWDRHLQREYGISTNRYDVMLKAQNGVCKICKRVNSSKQRLSVDHDHKTGKIRGLVCNCCNVTLGGIERMGSADPFLTYLDMYR